MQRKHFLLKLGLHSLTGSRKIIAVVRKFGHCVSYNLMSDIETAQANCSLSLSKKGDIRPVLPSSKNDVVPTFFSADNFDTIVERVGGGGSVNVTLVAFQEIAPNNIVKTRDSTVPPRKTIGLFYVDINTDYKPVHKTKEPEKLVVEICDKNSLELSRRI